MRQPADWMRPIDDRILEVLQTAGITLSPAIIAYNLDMNREAVNRRLAELVDGGLVEKIERGLNRRRSIYSLPQQLVKDASIYRLISAINRA